MDGSAYGRMFGCLPWCPSCGSSENCPVDSIITPCSNAFHSQPGDPMTKPPASEQRCPACESHHPHLHPAMQSGGEVQPCRDDFHRRVDAQNTPERIAEVDALLAANPAEPPPAPPEQPCNVDYPVGWGRSWLRDWKCGHCGGGYPSLEGNLVVCGTCRVRHERPPARGEPVRRVREDWAGDIAKRRAHFETAPSYREFEATTDVEQFIADLIDRIAELEKTVLDDAPGKDGAK